MAAEPRNELIAGPAEIRYLLAMTSTVWPRLEPLLSQVQAPSQYIGGELNAVMKDWDRSEVHVAIAFPDTYGIGMSLLHLARHPLDCGGTAVLHGSDRRRRAAA